MVRLRILIQAKGYIVSKKDNGMERKLNLHCFLINSPSEQLKVYIFYET